MPIPLLAQPAPPSVRLVVNAPHEPRESSSVASMRLLGGLLCCYDLLCPIRSSFKFAFFQWPFFVFYKKPFW